MNPLGMSVYGITRLTLKVIPYHPKRTCNIPSERLAHSVAVGIVVTHQEPLNFVNVTSGQRAAGRNIFEWKGTDPKTPG